MRVQSWRCGLLVCCSTLCYSVRTLSVVWRRSWMPNWSPRSPSLQVYRCSLLLAADSCHWLSHREITLFSFQKHFSQVSGEISVCALSDLHSVLCGLLHSDPAQRMTLDQLLLQSWISQPISLAEYSWTEVVPATQSYCEYSLTVVLYWQWPAMFSTLDMMRFHL